MGRKRKTIDEKLLRYFSRPRKQWTRAREIARYIREPLEHVEFSIAKLTDQGDLLGVEDLEDNTFWVQSIWTKGELGRLPAEPDSFPPI